MKMRHVDYLILENQLAIIQVLYDAGLTGLNHNGRMRLEEQIPKTLEAIDELYVKFSD